MTIFSTLDVHQLIFSRSYTVLWWKNSILRPIRIQSGLMKNCTSFSLLPKEALFAPEKNFVFCFNGLLMLEVLNWSDNIRKTFSCSTSNSISVYWNGVHRQNFGTPCHSICFCCLLVCFSRFTSTDNFPTQNNCPVLWFFSCTTVDALTIRHI